MSSRFRSLTARLRSRSAPKPARLVRLGAGLGLPVLIMTVAVSTSPSVAQTPAHAPAAAPAVASDAIFLAASLNGRNEVPVPGGPAVGDRDGRASALIRIQGDQVCFSEQWTRIGAPVAAHIHAAPVGVNGPVVVLFFGTPLPDTLRAVAGCVTVSDAGLIQSLRNTPQNFYVNIHTAEFPGGAVRGQLHRLGHAADLLGFVRGDLVSLADGMQETPTLGDLDANFTGFVAARRSQVQFAFRYFGMAPPTLGHIHAGRIGVAGPIVVPLLMAPMGLPPSLFAIAGVVNGVDRGLVRQINRHPSQFYLNLHNADFPAGAARGQLFRVGDDDD